jgi:hypothetical protein
MDYKTKCWGDARKIFNSPNSHTALFLTRLSIASTNSHLYQSVQNFDNAMAIIPMKRLRCCGTLRTFLSACGILSAQLSPFLILKLPSSHGARVSHHFPQTPPLYGSSTRDGHQSFKSGSLLRLGTEEGSGESE